MINLHDLMDERSELPPPTLDRSRMVGVRARIAARRRARLATVGAGCALVLAIIAGYAVAPHRATPPAPAATPSPSASPTPGPTPSPNLTEQPSQPNGHYVAGFTMAFSERIGTHRWTPTTLDGVALAVTLHSDFPVDSPLTVRITISVNGHPEAIMWTGIGQPGTQSWLVARDGVVWAGIRVGVPSTVMVHISTFSGPDEDELISPPANTWATIRIVEPVAGSAFHVG
ncbi:hypothetical protein F4553_005921 [Allocatelliglobosispora scoriae]|uniref:Uncharacterized protein n=1 Tax=Allocatelliglobosispora scoriae TaxID=643052 RepID=A0A841BTS5_9ACTN|nr:hypothetical protein [Allocatelliglobosispora scoriae]MBB5872487.1 hypothetical protein [Allocatelliglobosispora scoriae]